MGEEGDTFVYANKTHLVVSTWFIGLHIHM